MLKWAVVFFDYRHHRRDFGFTGVEQASASIAKVLFAVFLVLFVGALAPGLFIGSKLMS